MRCAAFACIPWPSRAGTSDISADTLGPTLTMPSPMSPARAAVHRALPVVVAPLLCACAGVDGWPAAGRSTNPVAPVAAQAPPEGTGVWPCAPVCEAMERITSAEIAKGFLIGARNSRGAHWRGEGGAQERELAAQYRGWSQKLTFEFPYVASVLEEIAATYDRDAEWHDSETHVSKRLRH